ncbi:MAG TPA: NUDIX domain-containing protein [Candidatus Binatia bacterium]|nr:NUDIX domain-containing protein [Candidatus Binatia bacterium]
MKYCLTSCAYIVDNHAVFLLFHKKYQKWLPPGGHWNEEELPCDTAIREAKEETGLEVELVHVNRIAQQPDELRAGYLPFHSNLHEAGPHQHIGLNYLARVKNGTMRDAQGYPQVQLDSKEGKEGRWLTAAEIKRLDAMETIKNIALLALQLA